MGLEVNLSSRCAELSVPFVDLARQHESIAGELRAAFQRVLDAGAFILGDEVALFESDFADYCGVSDCVGVASGTAALTIMLQAAGIGRGDEVIVPAHTFIASALAVLHAGATPVCVEVERGSGLLDPAAVRAAVGPSTAAILAVHLYGQVCAMDELQELADQNSLALFEDAAQAHGASYRGRRAGGLGRAAAFSFYPSKNLGAMGDGGAICTNDVELASRARQLRDLGRDQAGAHTVLGRNERLDGLQAAILRTKLQYLDDWIAARRALAADYRSYLDDRVELLSESSISPCTYHLFPIKVSDREALGNELADRGVATGVHYPTSVPDHQSLMGRSLAPDPVPVARDWAARELSLPIFPGMSHQELEHVAVAVNLCIASQQPSSTRTDVLDMDRGRVLGNGAGSRHGWRGWVKQ